MLSLHVLNEMLPKSVSKWNWAYLTLQSLNVRESQLPYISFTLLVMIVPVFFAHVWNTAYSAKEWAMYCNVLVQQLPVPPEPLSTYAK
jgi:hypothetical protein